MKRDRDQETSNRKHEEFISRFESPLYDLAFTTVKDFTITIGSSTKGPYNKELQWSTQDRSTQLQH